jgi:hypothetical protein
MKASNVIKATGLMLMAMIMFQFATAQYIQNWRPYDQTGVNIFEPAKDLTTEYNGLKVRVGGSFTQQFQALSHTNTATDNGAGGANELYPIAPGFNLATANLNIDVQLADGIRISLENYMSSRHHSEFWVKGGYIQVDKLPMFGTPDWFTENFRVKIGHFQVNYGDQQFRRSDNGNTMYNPFVGNYIMDAFATEIGGELYYFNPAGLMVMFGMTGGTINGGTKANALGTDEDPLRAPSVYGKVAYDKEINEDVRVRLSGSLYMNNGGVRNTLYSGDRTGSRFYNVMQSPAGATFTSGRLNPGFTSEVRSIQVNPFVKLYGLEVFGTYETSTGLAYGKNAEGGLVIPEARTVSQIGVEGVYRFLENEQLYIGGRYNKLSGELTSVGSDISSDRIEVVAGWFPIKNLLLKASYVNQNYDGYPTDNILNGGNFKGVMIEAAVGF